MHATIDSHPPQRPPIKVVLTDAPFAANASRKDEAARAKAALLAAAEAVPWRAQMLLAAPHRLGFALAMLVLVAASVWWALVQVDRVSASLHLAYTVAPALLHGAVMVFGFMPLFFAGFLFTAGPKWLNVAPPVAQDVLWPMLLQTGGWLLWLAGGHAALPVALAGGVLALVGLAWQFGMFWQLVRQSTVADRLHAKSVGVAGVAGALALAGMLAGVLAGRADVARVCMLSGLWAFVVPVFVVVAHRMIPFFTSNAVPLVQVWRPFWVLWLMLGATGFELLALWAEWLGLQGSVWMLLRGAAEIGAGGFLLWLAVAWGLAQSLKIRLLAMLHIGFVWLGLSYVLGGLAQWLGLASGAVVFGLGSLHALTMGALGSLMLAMVTRVSCGHSGRALVADDAVWALFWLLQMATVLRLLAALPGMPSALLLAAALLWLAVMGAWSTRYARWYGKPRVDGKEG